MPGRSPQCRATLIAIVMLLIFPLHAARASNAAPAALPDSLLGTEAAGEACGSEILLQAALARDPGLAARREVFENMLRVAQQNGLVPAPRLSAKSTNATIYTIPVVVHIIHSGVGGDPENISDAQVLSQIAAVNRDLQNTLLYPPPATNCQLQFCLASKDPSGNTVTGITRKLDPVNCVIQFGNLASETATKAIDYYPSNKYLNVWVVKQIAGGSGGIVGFAQFPGTVAAPLDGIVMDYRVMGANNTGYGTFPVLLPTYDQGKVFAHEVGHYLDILHTFHDGCTPGDLVADTPPEALNNWNCPTTTPTSCSNSGDPIHNFMDYTNDPCRWEFTPGQQSRMFAAISVYRAQLVSPTNLVTVGACPPSLFAVATASPSQTCVNSLVSLSAPACGGSCSYAWSMPGGTPPTSTGQFTSVTYASPGAHVVTLTMSNGTNTSIASTTVYVSACTPVTGACANWVFGNQIRLNFASGMPVAAGGTMNAGPEPSSQISSSSGSLLFYTDNKTIWNANNAVMANSATFTTLAGGNSAHTGALIVPRPSTPGQYFLFSVNEWEKRNTSANLNPLSITTIDATLNSGLGGVTSTCVPINLPVGVTTAPRGLLEGVTLIPHCNGTDWWLITCGADSTNTSRDWERFLYVTLITQSGAAATSTAYPIGFTGAGGGASAWGTITASKDGTKFAVCQGGAKSIHIYKFDRASGVPTLAIDTGDIGANQDVAFSPNGNIVYYTFLTGAYDSFANGLWGLRQLDLTTQQVRILRAPVQITGTGDVALGPDDKVYASRAGSTTLDCINFPDNFNLNDQNECGFNLGAIPLGSTTNAGGALPNVLSICSSSPPPAAFTYKVTNCKTVTFTSPNCGPTWSWDFGDNSALGSGQSVVHTYATSGTYQVKLTTSGAVPPTLTLPVTLASATAISITGPSSTCGGPSNYSVVGPSNFTYTWTITGGSPATATGNNVFVSWGLSSGIISVTGTDPATGCTSTAGLGLEACSQCTPPPDNIVAWWPLDESTGAVAQEIVAANDGQDVNGPLKLAGAVGNARQFNGSNSYVRVNDDPKIDLGTGNLTLDAWIQTSASNASYQGIVEKRSLSPDLGYALYLKQGKLALLLGDASTSTEYVASNTANLADGKWHHVAATEDRGNSAAGTTLYADGVPVMVLPGYTGGNVDNAEKLLIGAMEPSASPSWFFSGMIDEVEVFTRALSASEVSSIWGSGAAGKCKELSHVPTGTTICNGMNYVLVPIQICNFTSASQTYTLSFANAPGAGCTIASAGISVYGQNNNQVTVGTGCQNFTLKVDRPSGMGPTDVACFSVTSMNTSNNSTRVSHGSIWDNENACPHATSGGLTPVGVALPGALSFGLTNTSSVPRPIDVTIDVRAIDATLSGPGGPGGPAPVVSLNGLPPGVPFTATYLLSAGETTSIPVYASFMQPMPFHLYDVVLSTDSDGDGVTDGQATAGLLYSDRPVHLTAVPTAPSPARFELVNVSPNPFARLLSVEFELPRPGRVKLALYDVSGRRVRNVPEDDLTAGRSMRMLDAGGLHSGVYFVRLEMDGQVRSRRVVLLKE